MYKSSVHKLHMKEKKFCIKGWHKNYVYKLYYRNCMHKIELQNYVHRFMFIGYAEKTINCMYDNKISIHKLYHK